MNEYIKILIGVALPFIGTVLGAAPILFLKKGFKASVFGILSGFAAGVMIAAGVWSLIIPALEMNKGLGGAITAALGLLSGAGVIALTDIIIQKFEIIKSQSNASKASFMTALAVTLHNVPEGIAVGVALSAAIGDSAKISFAQVLGLTLGIAIQNIPEGAIISMPLAASGSSKWRAFYLGAISGIVEPIGAVAALMLTSLFAPALPFILAAAAGAMLYVSGAELIPCASRDCSPALGNMSLALGFALMMSLDVILG